MRLISPIRLSLLLCLVVSVGCQRLAGQNPEEPRGQQDLSAPIATQPASVVADNGQTSWPLFRGDAHATGVATATLPNDLALLWKFEVKDGAFEGTAAIEGGVAYIGDLDGTVYALELKTGEKKWDYKTEAGFIASPAIRDGLVYIGDYDGRFYCIEAASGKLRWGFDTGAEIDSCANFYKGNVLVGSQDATLYCLEAKTGDLVWKHMIDDQIRCSPTIVEDRVFLAGCDGKLHILDLTDGKDIAQVEIGGPTGVTPAVVGDFVYFGTEGGEFLCINWREASVAWTFTGKNSPSYRSSAAATTEQVIVGSRAKRVHALNPKDGAELWTFATKQRIDSSPVIVGDRVYVGSSDGRLYGLNRDSGEKEWEYEAKGGFTGSPAVVDGKLVIASDDGVVYCFSEKKD